MTARTITITDPAKVRVGDQATLRFQGEKGTTYEISGGVYSGVEHKLYVGGWDVDRSDSDGFGEFVSATREVPELNRYDGHGVTTIARAARGVLALVAADEQAAEGEASQAAPWLYKAGDQILADDFDRGVTPENLPNILDAAPVGTVVRDEEGDTWTKKGDGWHCPQAYSPTSASSAVRYGPLTVVSVGGAS